MATAQQWIVQKRYTMYPDATSESHYPPQNMIEAPYRLIRDATQSGAQP